LKTLKRKRKFLSLFKKTFTEGILDDFERLEKANVIPEECKEDVERIRKIVRK